MYRVWIIDTDIGELADCAGSGASMICLDAAEIEDTYELVKLALKNGYSVGIDEDTDEDETK